MFMLQACPDRNVPNSTTFMVKNEGTESIFIHKTFIFLGNFKTVQSFCLAISDDYTENNKIKVTSRFQCQIW